VLGARSGGIGAAARQDDHFRTTLGATRCIGSSRGDVGTGGSHLQLWAAIFVTTIPLGTAIALRTAILLRTAIALRAAIRSRTAIALWTTILLRTAIALWTTILLRTAIALWTTILLRTAVALRTTILLRTAVALWTTIRSRTPISLWITILLRTAIALWTTTRLRPTTRSWTTVERGRATVVALARRVLREARSWLRRGRPPRGQKLRRQLATHISSPNFAGVTAQPRTQAGIDRREVAKDIARIANEEPFGLAVLRRRNDLREIDDGRA